MTLSRFKQYLHKNIKFIMAMYAVISVVITIVILCFKNRFACGKIVIALLVMYIVYILISLIDVILIGSATKHHKPVPKILKFTGKNINIKKTGKKKGINDHARRNNKNSSRSN